jgi:hypothetical protein
MNHLKLNYVRTALHNQAGINMRLEDTTTMPYSAWGKVKKSVGGFLLSARGDVSSKDLDTVAIDFRLDGPSTSIDIAGSAGKHSFCKRNNLISLSISRSDQNK